MRINNFYYFFTSECNALTILNVNNRTLGMYPKYLFYLFEGNNKTENANVYDYASMISPIYFGFIRLKKKIRTMEQAHTTTIESTKYKTKATFPHAYCSKNVL